MCVCVCVFISSIEIQTNGPILVKFDTELLLNVGKVRSWVSTPYLNLWGPGSPKWGLTCLCSLNRLTW
jgi:hypothetical protein